jgi:hypothetical protein
MNILYTGSRAKYTTNNISVMLILSSSSALNYQDDGTYTQLSGASKPPNEFGGQPLDQWDGELSDRHVYSSSEKLRLPRHISSLEAPSHSRAIKARLHQAPKKCPLNQNTSLAVDSNRAIDMLRYQLQDTAFAEKYLENVRRNLQYRLEVAQLGKNCRLVTILQEEVRQLEASI